MEEEGLSDEESERVMELVGDAGYSCSRERRLLRPNAGPGERGGGLDGGAEARSLYTSM